MLQQTRTEAAPVALNYATAVRRLKEAARSTTLPNTARLEDAVDAARRQWPIAELVRLSPFDAYETLAAVCLDMDSPRAVSAEERSYAFQPLPSSEVQTTVPTSVRSLALRVTGDIDAGSKQHQRLLKRLVVACERRNYSVWQNLNVDARVERRRQQLLFEVKTAANHRAFIHQLRLAVGQLLEYRHRYSARRLASICVVIEDHSTSRASVDWVRAAGIGLVLASAAELAGLDEVLDDFEQ